MPPELLNKFSIFTDTVYFVNGIKSTMVRVPCFQRITRYAGESLTRVVQLCSYLHLMWFYKQQILFDV